MTRAKKIALLITKFLLVAIPATAQIDMPIIPPAKDTRELVKRASASRMVIVGTVVKSEGVSRRLSVAEIRERLQLKEAEKNATVSLPPIAGSLFTIRLQEVLCRQEYWQIQAASIPASSPEPLDTVTLFVPRDEPLWKDGNQLEALIVGHKYLLFLVLPNPATKQEWVNSFQLDQDKVYFRGEQRSRGIVPVSSPNSRDSSLVLEKVTRLCEAVRPRTLDAKLTALERLVMSGDAILEREAQVAVDLLRSRSKSSHP